MWGFREQRIMMEAQFTKKDKKNVCVNGSMLASPQTEFTMAHLKISASAACKQ